MRQQPLVDIARQPEAFRLEVASAADS